MSTSCFILVLQVAKSFLEWLLEIEAKANAENDISCNDISECRSLLEKYKILRRELDGRSDVLEKIKGMKEEDESSGPVDADIEACLDKHAEIVQLIQDQTTVCQTFSSFALLR